MNEPPLLSINNHVVVGKNPSSKQADEGGNAWIERLMKMELKSNLHWMVGVSPQRILREANINMLARQFACDDHPQPSLLSVHYSSERHNNSQTEKRSMEKKYSILPSGMPDHTLAMWE